MEGGPLSTADMKSLRRPVYYLLARVKGLYIQGRQFGFLLLFVAVKHCRGKHYSVELSFFGVSEGPAVAVPASRWQK